jgi:hypothetical protein
MKTRSNRRLLAALVPLTSISIRPSASIVILIVIPTKVTNPTPRPSLPYQRIFHF